MSAGSEAVVIPIGADFREPMTGRAMADYLAGLAVMRKLGLLPTAQIVDFHSWKRNVEQEKE
jgi:hypothetical protein